MYSGDEYYDDEITSGPNHPEPDDADLYESFIEGRDEDEPWES